jgi:hypothetical protein
LLKCSFLDRIYSLIERGLASAGFLGMTTGMALSCCQSAMYLIRELPAHGPWVAIESNATLTHIQSTFASGLVSTRLSLLFDD